MAMKAEAFSKFRVRMHGWLSEQLKALGAKPLSRKVVDGWPEYSMKFSFGVWEFDTSFYDVDHNDPRWIPRLSMTGYDSRSADEYDTNSGPEFGVADLSIADCADTDRLSMLLSQAWLSSGGRERRLIYFATAIDLPEDATKDLAKVVARALVRIARDVALHTR